MNGTVSLVVYDFSGKVVRKTETAKRTVILQRDFGLPTGMYLVHSDGKRHDSVTD